MCRRSLAHWRSGNSLLLLVAALLLASGATPSAALRVRDPDADTMVPANAVKGQSIKRDVSNSGAPLRNARGTSWVEADRPTAAALNDMELVEQKRHLGAAMNMLRPAWLQQGGTPFYHRPIRFQIGDINRDSEFRDEDSEFDKRHLGSALNMRFRGLVGLSEPMKRHLGAALKFRQLRQPRFDEWRQMHRLGWNRTPTTYKDSRDSLLGSLYRTHSHSRRYRSNLRAKRNAETFEKAIIGKDTILDQDVAKRHIGAALYPGRQSWYNQPQQKFHIESKRQRNADDDESDNYNNDWVIQNGGDAAEDLELYQRFLPKRHFGAALNLVRGRPKWKTDGYHYVVDKEKRDTKNDEENELMSTDLEQNVSNLESLDYDHHLRSALQFQPGEASASMDKRDSTEDQNEDTEDLEIDEGVVNKRHLGAALAFGNGNKSGKRHWASALSAGKKDNYEGDGSDYVKRHLSSVMQWTPSMGKRHFGAARNAGNGKVWVHQGKRHMGSAMNLVGQLSAAQKENVKRNSGSDWSAVKTEDEDGEGFDKRHLGSAMKWAASSNKYQHLGEARNSGNGRYWVRQGKREDVKRHMGAALSAGKREINENGMSAVTQGKDDDDDDDDADDDDDVNRSKVGAMITSGKSEIDEDKTGTNKDKIDKRHLGSAMKFKSIQRVDEKRHLGSAMKFRATKAPEEKRHFGSAIKFRNQQNKRHLGSAMKFRNSQTTEEKRHLGSAMKFRNVQVDKEKRHLGSAMKFRDVQVDKEKRHLGSAMKFRDVQVDEEKRHLGSAMKFRDVHVDKEKRHLGAAMKFRHFQNAEEKRNLGAAMNFGHGAVGKDPDEQNHELKRFGSSMNFGRWGSSSKQRTFGGPFNVRRLNPSLGKEEEK